MLPHQQIVPKNYLDSVGTKGFSCQTVGAGPFKFVEGKLDERIVMERYDKYYGGSPDIKPVGPPLLKRVLFEVIPRQPHGLRRFRPARLYYPGCSPHMVETLKRDPNVQVKTASVQEPTCLT